MKFFYKFIILALLTAIIMVLIGNQGMLQLKKIELKISKMEYASNQSLNLNIPLLKTSLTIERLLSQIKGKYEKIVYANNLEEVDRLYNEILELKDLIKNEGSYLKEYKELKLINKNLEYLDKMIKKLINKKSENLKLSEKKISLEKEYKEKLKKQNELKIDFLLNYELTMEEKMKKAIKRSSLFLIKSLGNTSSKITNKTSREKIETIMKSKSISNYFLENSLQNNGYFFLLDKDNKIIYHPYLNNSYFVYEDKKYFPKKNKNLERVVIEIEEIENLDIKIAGILYLRDYKEYRKVGNFESFYQEILDYENDFLKYGKDDFSNLKFSKGIFDEVFLEMASENIKLRNIKNELKTGMDDRVGAFDKVFINIINIKRIKLEQKDITEEIEHKIDNVEQSLKEIQDKADKVIKEANMHYYSLKDEIKEVINKSMDTQFIIVILGLLTAGIFVFSLFADIHQNLSKSKEFLKKLNNGDYSVRIKKISKGEFNSFYTNLNKMAEKLERGQKELKELTENLELQVEVRTEGLVKANKTIKEQEQRLVDEAYNRGIIEVSSGVVHNIGNIINVLYLNLSEITLEFPKSRKKVFVFIKEILYPSLNSLKEKDKELEKIVAVIPELSELLENVDTKLLSNLELSMKKIEHIRSVIRLQQNFIGSLGTENYYNINEVLDEISEIYMVSIESRSIKFRKEYSNLPKILFDKNQIIQVFGNIIKNAYESIEENDEINGEILVKTEFDKEKKEILIIVKDNGQGIKKEHLDKIFEFGFSSKREIKRGSGFGLHHSRDIIRKYKGEIEVESSEGKGTSFKVNIPLIK